MYQPDGGKSEAWAHVDKTKYKNTYDYVKQVYGEPGTQFGYREFIPMFKAEKWNPDEWAALFKQSGADFAGPVAEHHDGFAMWDTKYSKWNAAKMGPKRDVVGELEKAIKKRDMKFVTAFHHAANWFFFPVWDKNYDTGDPANSGLYGQPHKPGALRNQEFLDEWYGKIIEVIDNYSPDFIWFDFALDSIAEGYVKDFLAYYYNHAEAKGKEVVVTYKDNDLVPATGVRDLELGQEPKITYHEWITDSTVDDRGAWGYANDLVFKTPDRVIDNLVDRVSKNGYLLLNVGPKPDGTIPEPARDLLLEMGAWLEVNGEGIYGTSPWIIAGEGPTNLGEIQRQGFNESDVVYTGEDIRFTVKGDTIYATFLDWPGERAVIRTLRAQGLEADKVDAEGADIPSIEGKTLNIRFEREKIKLVFKEDGEVLISGGEAGEGMIGHYKQDGADVGISVAQVKIYCTYDGEELEMQEDESPAHPGFYKEEIKRISLLGDGKSLDWKLTRKGLVVEMPDTKPSDYAHVIKIERYHHPKID
jgi:alpha-L-fucosidase